MLDAVYNHLGPDGNYLGAYTKNYFNPAHKTPWGDALNFDGEHNAPVREFFLGNAVYWMEEFHFDGFRLDAIHAILDDSGRHILANIAAAVQDRGGFVLPRTSATPRSSPRRSPRAARDLMACGRTISITACAWRSPASARRT